jgi:hypothetical protein
MRVLTPGCLLLALWHSFKHGDLVFGNESERQSAMSIPCESGEFHSTSEQIHTISHYPESMTRTIAPQNTLGNIRMKDASPRDLVSQSGVQQRVVGWHMSATVMNTRIKHRMCF